MLWRQASGKGYEDMLPPEEFAALECHFQQRHLFAHRDGIVDDAYIAKTHDGTYSVRQRIVLREASVLSLADLVMRLAKQLNRL